MLTSPDRLLAAAAARRSTFEDVATHTSIDVRSIITDTTDYAYVFQLAECPNWNRRIPQAAGGSPGITSKADVHPTGLLY